MLFSVLLLTITNASADPNQGIVPLNQRFLNDSDLDRVCAAEMVFIGTITAANSYWKTEGWMSDSIHSNVTFQVERNVIGVNAPTFSLSLPGGVIGDDRVIAGGWPRIDTGLRYLMAFTTAKEGYGGVEEGDLLLSRYYWLDSSLPLPTVTSIRNTLEVACE